MSTEIAKLLKDLEVDPHRLVTCGEVSQLIHAVLKVGDDQTAGTIRTLVAFITGAIQRVSIDRVSSILQLSQQLKGYVDGKVDGLSQAIVEAKQTTWN